MVVLGIGFQLQSHFPVESDGIACLLTSSPLDKKPAYSHSFMEDLCLLLDAFRIVSLFLLALNFMKYLHVDFSFSCSVLSRSYTFAHSHLPSVLNFFSCKFHPTIFLFLLSRTSMMLKTSINIVWLIFLLTFFVPDYCSLLSFFPLIL